MSVTRRIAGRYRLVEKVGTGGMGVLWAAFDDRSEQSVAVRILQRGVDEPGRVAHFRASARAAARLAHPAVARVLDEGHDPDVGPFIVSEWIDGWPLTAWRGLTPPWAFTRAILIQLCDALSHIHARGLVHLDLRPGNLMVTAGEHGPVLRVVDVGCARIDDGWSDHSVGAQATLKLLGSLKYMAPEVGDAPPWLHGAWSDLYSVGLVGWELLTGKLPHDELQGVALLMRRASEPAPLLPAGFGGESNNTALRTLMQRLLATNPAERPLSAAQVRKTLEALPPGPNEWRWLDPPRGPKVRQAPFDAARARAGAFPLWPLQPGPVVGRDAELARVTEALHQTVAGYGARLIVLEGIVGAGKSRLAQEATQEAEERGFLRAWRVHFTAGGAPGSGLTGALEDLLRAAGTDADGVARRVAALPLLLGVDPTGLEAALPALLRPDPTPFARPGNEADPGAEVGNVGSAHMVAGAFLELLRRASANETIALWLDDLHLATPAEGLDLVQ
ncbi:serine/threonine-protein kinase, partial [Myxococcota bacterium]|nr:serine/threonine-protein kinase [Myxococcota bacterium]